MQLLHSYSADIIVLILMLMYHMYIVHDPVHVLQPLILDHPASSYDFRPRTHDKLLLNKTTYLNEREFVIRMLYKDSY